MQELLPVQFKQIGIDGVLGMSFGVVLIGNPDEESFAFLASRSILVILKLLRCLRFSQASPG